MDKFIIAFFAIVLSASVQASVVINSTRVIYPAASKEVTVQLSNNGSQVSLVQSWIDDGDIESTPETAEVPFLLSPPVVRVAAGNGQQLRIQKKDEQLPQDREAVFYLNVLEVPATPEHLIDTNRLQLAIRSRIKMFHRPASLRSPMDLGVKDVQLRVASDGLSISNGSGYFLTVLGIYGADEKDALSDSVMIEPFATKVITPNIILGVGNKYTLRYIDDFGARKTLVVNMN